MAVKIRLKRMGKIHAPFYRVVVMDSRAKRDGRAIEEIGKYHPTEEPSVIQVDSERVQHWLTQGAQPTEAVAALLRVTGDWQKFKGEPGAEGTLKVKAPKASKKEVYDAAVAATGKSPDASEAATTPRKKAEKKSEPRAEEPTPEEPRAEEPRAEQPKAEEPTPEEPKAEEPTPEEVAPAADTDSGAASVHGTNTDADTGAEQAASADAEDAETDEAGA